MSESKVIEKIFAKYINTQNYHPTITDTEKNLRLHLNENLFGPSEECVKALKLISLEDISLYDLKENDDLLIKINEVLGYPPQNTFIHNGSSEILKMIFEMSLEASDVIMLPNPCFKYYESLSDFLHLRRCYYDIVEQESSYAYDKNNINTAIKKYAPKVVVITSPNMPTGNSIPADMLLEIIAKNDEILFIVDQAYWGFVDCNDELDIMNIINSYSNVVFVRTFSKFYGLANERIGFCVCCESLRDVFTLGQPLFKISLSSRKLAEAALNDIDYYSNMRKVIIAEREHFINELNKVTGVKAFCSNANFAYIKIMDNDGFAKIKADIQESGYLVKFYKNNKMRITISKREVMDDLIDIFSRNKL